MCADKKTRQMTVLERVGRRDPRAEEEPKSGQSCRIAVGCEEGALTTRC